MFWNNEIIEIPDKYIESHIIRETIDKYPLSFIIRFLAYDEDDIKYELEDFPKVFEKYDYEICNKGANILYEKVKFICQLALIEDNVVIDEIEHYIEVARGDIYQTNCLGSCKKLHACHTCPVNDILDNLKSFKYLQLRTIVSLISEFYDTDNMDAALKQFAMPLEPEVFYNLDRINEYVEKVNNNINRFFDFLNDHSEMVYRVLINVYDCIAQGKTLYEIKHPISEPTIEFMDPDHPYSIHTLNENKTILYFPNGIK